MPHDGAEGYGGDNAENGAEERLGVDTKGMKKLMALLFIVFLFAQCAPAQAVDTTNVIIIDLSAWTLVDIDVSPYEIRSLPPAGHCVAISLVQRGQIQFTEIHCGNVCFFGARAWLYGWPVHNYIRKPSCENFVKLMQSVEQKDLLKLSGQ